MNLNEYIKKWDADSLAESRAGFIESHRARGVRVPFVNDHDARELRDAADVVNLTRHREVGAVRFRVSMSAPQFTLTLPAMETAAGLAAAVVDLYRALNAYRGAIGFNPLTIKDLENL